MELANLPPATARLAVELQLADINAVMQDLGAGDAYAAFDAMQAGLKAALSLLQDQICAMEILRADHDDRVLFENLVLEERQAEQDHEMARGMCDVTHGGTGHSTPRPAECFEVQEPWLDDTFQDPDARLGGAIAEDYVVNIPEDTFITYLGHGVQRVQQVTDDPAASYAESSTRPVGKGKGRGKGAVDDHVTHTFCSACMEQFTRFDVLELGCKREDDDTYHAYCRSCLVDLFQTSLTDTTLFPPRCCGKYIPVLACVDLLPPALVKQYQDKQLELASPNPVYCSNRYCAKFIKAGDVAADVAPAKTGGNDVRGVGLWSNYSWAVIICDAGAVWDENRLLSVDQMLDEPGNEIAMPEEQETLEADPALDVLNDLQLRVATVAGGFAITNNEEDAGSDGEQLIDSCQHHWKRAYGKDGDLEIYEGL
ncbi:uncharacterized protein N0V89_011707 [Didymosphaeria variabile]|uniref:RING-type domain-containing protein n=1 Tax=Didymosphaeria variabile TaxID=1932322 RepID=A0A9W9C5Z8_9PLEO|nr:uncharacterized protein N0V89_011707 [Didymosphaeria variabile]KAJ4345574.1 hypothetical protein N0V89_011707 [Didymosphaeria variabile]